MKIVTEIINFEIIENISAKEFIDIVDKLEKNFHMKQKGYIDTELLYLNEENRWAMIQHWENIEDFKCASSNMFKEESTERFREVLIKTSVKITVYSQEAMWNKI